MMLMIFLHSLLLAANPIVKKEKAPMGKTEFPRASGNEAMIDPAPVTPLTATFEEADTIDSSFNMNRTTKEMAPVTPKEATFEDSVPDTTGFTTTISPSTPEEATFDDFASN